MKHITVYLGVLVILSAPSHAADMPAASLFFTPEQVRQIETPPEKTASVPETVPASIHLGAVLYYGPRDWAVWIDNQRWTPETRRADLRIVEVNAEQVRLRVSTGVLPNSSAQFIELKPNQIYQMATGRIVEGEP